MAHDHFQNLVPVCFHPSFVNEQFLNVKYLGMQRAKENLLAKGYHPSFVKAVLKKIIRERGW